MDELIPALLDRGWRPQPPGDIRLDSQLQVAFANRHAKIRAINLYASIKDINHGVCWRSRALVVTHIPRTQNSLAEKDAEAAALIAKWARAAGLLSARGRTTVGTDKQ